jgi:hypothetical protein
VLAYAGGTTQVCLPAARWPEMAAERLADRLTRLGGPVRPAVAYSRVHTGVPYPGDAVAGSLIGAGTGQAVAGLMDRLPPRSASTTTE